MRSPDARARVFAKSVAMGDGAQADAIRIAAEVKGETRGRWTYDKGGILLLVGSGEVHHGFDDLDARIRIDVDRPVVGAPGGRTNA